MDQQKMDNQGEEKKSHGREMLLITTLNLVIIISFFVIFLVTFGGVLEEQSLYKISIVLTGFILVNILLSLVFSQKYSDKRKKFFSLSKIFVLPYLILLILLLFLYLIY